MRKLLILLLFPVFAFHSKAQQANCTFKKPFITIHFGSGTVDDVNAVVSSRYGRVPGYCPTDGHYAYTPYTSDCFRGDWFTLKQDHTPGDENGNMLLVNSSPRSGIFLRTTINGLKGGTSYEFAVWLMNLCRITEKCPFPLLPNINISLQTTEGKTVAQLVTGEVARVETPRWKQYKMLFTTPPSATTLTLLMINNAPGGCGNDFALDDITFRECVRQTPAVASEQKKPTAEQKSLSATKTPVKKVSSTPTKKQPAIAKPIVKKTGSTPLKKQPPTAKPVANKVSSTSTKKPIGKGVQKEEQPRQLTKLQTESPKFSSPKIKQGSLAFPPPPRVLTARTNLLVQQIETDAGEIRIDLYDNGEIDDDTVSIYHNNSLLAANARLSQKPITFRILIDIERPHHELIMVAKNLGSIPPNTSLMIVTAGEKRYEVFISSTRQKNAKVVLNLKN